MKKIGFFALLLLMGIWACEYETIVPGEVVLPDEPVSFSEQIAPIFVEVGCVDCHNGSTPPDLNLDKSYNDLTNRDMVDTANPAESKLMKKIDTGHGTAGNMSALQKALVLKWIEEGAEDN